MGCETVEKNSNAEIYAVRRNAYFPVRIVTNLSHLILAPSHFQLYGEQYDIGTLKLLLLNLYSIAKAYITQN